MFREITENTLSKAKEEVSVPNWLIVAVALAAFLTGLVVGILCSSGQKRTRRRKNSFNANAYVRDLNFDIDDNDDDDDYDDDDDGFEFSF